MAACATEESVEFGDPARVTGGFSSGSGSEVECTPTPLCGVSFSSDIYQNIFTAPLDGATPSGACAESNCHNEGAGGLVLPASSAAEAHANLLKFKLFGSLPYVVPCHPELSYIVCNLLLQPGATNPYIGPNETFQGGCGSQMPKSTQEVTTQPLTGEQLATIAEWITCGAPLN
ncbi:MAG TPA: hypothetical protein ENK23_03640 [Sorangium sp.]|nr:hypothetical protein [Sorangium sp.]